MDVHAALDRFMRTDDFLAGKRVVDELQQTLLSNESFDYLRQQLEAVEPDTPLAQVLGLKPQMLLDCRRMSIGYAFAWMFLEFYPDPVPEEVATAIAAATESPDAIPAWAERDPQALAAVQQVVAGNQLREGLQSELTGTVFPPGDARRVEALRLMVRLCDRRIDPEAAAMAAGELANAISGCSASPEATVECIRLYQSILADAPAREDMIANAHHGLGSMHARGIAAQDGDDSALARARHHFSEALRLRTGPEAAGVRAQTHHALGRALLAAAASEPSLAREAASSLASALDVYATHAVPEAAWLDAQQAICLAYAICDRDDDSGSAERLIPNFDGRPLVLADRLEAPGIEIEEWIAPGESLPLWEQLITIERYGSAADMPFAGWMMATRQGVASRVTDGELQWEVLEQSDTGLLYRWRLTGDYAIEDQEGLGRLLRGRRDLHAMRFVSRRTLSDTERAAWLTRLAALPLRSTGPREELMSTWLAPEKVLDRVTSLGSRSMEPVTDVRAFPLKLMDGVSRSRTPELYVGLLSLCGLHLMVARDPAGRSTAAATAVLRRAVETATPHSEEWARAVAALAKVYLQRAAREDLPDTRRARLAFQKAAEVFVERGLTSDLGAAVVALGHCDRLTATSAGELAGVLRLYLEGLECQPVETDPLGWSETTIAFGDVCLQLFRLTRDVASREQAEAAYQRVLAAFASDPVFASDGRMGIEEVMARAIGGLQDLDRMDLPLPIFPPGYRDRETYGKLLFLRPLVTARAMRVENRFRHPERFAVRFDPDPASYTLESALYRALHESYSFSSIGGASDGTGASRIFALGGEGWKDIALSQFDRADMILFLPSDSPGVRWEVETLSAKRLISKVVFLMPPSVPDFDSEGLWRDADRLLSASAIEVPPWDPAGLFFTVDGAGQLEWTLPFDALWEQTLHIRLAERFKLRLPA